MALKMTEQLKRPWKTPSLTSAVIDLPVVLTICTGFAGMCSSNSSCCKNVGAGCFGGGTCNPKP